MKFPKLEKMALEVEHREIRKRNAEKEGAARHSFIAASFLVAIVIGDYLLGPRGLILGVAVWGSLYGIVQLATREALPEFPEEEE